MAKYQTTMQGDLDAVRERIVRAFRRGEWTMTRVDTAEATLGDTRVQCFLFIKNAPGSIEADALSLTLAAHGGQVKVMALTSGRAQVDDIIVDTSVRPIALISRALEGPSG